MSIKLMTMVWETDVSPATKRLVLLALADSANDEGVCWPSVATLARKAGVGHSSAEQALRHLERNGLLRRDHREQQSTMYVINVEALAGHAPPREIDGTPREIHGETPVKSEPTPREIHGQNRKENHQEEPSRETHTARERAELVQPKRQTPEQYAEEHGFDEWWAAYPRKVAKLGAAKAYTAALRRDKGLTPAILLAAAKWYAEAQRGADPRYTKHPSTWLNQGCWADENQARRAADGVVPAEAWSWD